MLIDWLTMRIPLNLSLGESVHKRLMDATNQVVCVNSYGVEKWRKSALDIDQLRSDSEGLFWQVNGDGVQYYLCVGASPASLEHQGVNVFGSDEINHCVKVLINAASSAISAVLPHPDLWQCRRLDITANYDLGSSAQVKQALRLLLGTDAPRRRTNSDSSGGDTVYWNPKSDLKSGKAYDKGAHLRFHQRKGKINVSDEILDKADNLLRLELKIGSRWFRRLYDAGHTWHLLTPAVLRRHHHDFFKTLIGDNVIEVNDMGTLLHELLKVCPTEGRANAAHCAWALIKTLGYTHTEKMMGRSTFQRHLKYLRAAGLSSADLCAGTVLQFRQRALVLHEPVMAWSDIRKAA